MPHATPDTRHYTASAAVFDTEARAVLLVHHLLTGCWQFPGGHIDPDEDGAACAIREVREETGVQAALWTYPRHVPGGAWLPEPLMVVEFLAPADPADPAGHPAHAHMDMLYVAVADSTAPLAAQEDEVKGARWFPIDTLPGADVRADVPTVAVLAWDFLRG